MNNLMISGSTFFDLVLLNDNTLKENRNYHDTDITINIGGVFNIARQLILLKVKFDIKTIAYAPINKNNLLQIAYLPPKFDKYCNLKVDFDEKSSNLSLILQGKSNKGRTSFNSNKFDSWEYKQKSSFYKCHHISYLDYLSNYSENTLRSIKKETNFVSADLCKNFSSKSEKAELIRKLYLIDLLVISDAEFKNYFGDSKAFIDLRAKFKVFPKVVVHFSDKVVIYLQSDTLKLQGVNYAGKNTLGMGDTFVAYFYKNFLKSNDIYQSAKFAFLNCQKIVKSL